MTARCALEEHPIAHSVTQVIMPANPADRLVHPLASAWFTLIWSGVHHIGLRNEVRQKLGEHECASALR
jgi:hypothetical protein